jgi:microcystin-dependent protein
MAQQIINIGTVPNDGTGDNIRLGGTKINDNFTELYSAIFPSGGIIMWSGTIATIPTGWVICDGTNSTPDLRNRFIVGASSDTGTGVTFNADNGNPIGDYAPGNTGGSVAHQLTTAEMPSHNHQLSRFSGNTNINTQSDRYALATNNNLTTDSTNSAGADNYHENRPPYYALAYIMKT